MTTSDAYTNLLKGSCHQRSYPQYIRTSVPIAGPGILLPCRHASNDRTLLVCRHKVKRRAALYRMSIYRVGDGKRKMLMWGGRASCSAPRCPADPPCSRTNCRAPLRDATRSTHEIRILDDSGTVYCLANDLSSSIDWDCYPILLVSINTSDL